MLARGESCALNWLRVAFAFLVLLGHTRQHLFVEYSVLGERDLNLAVQGIYFFTGFGAASVVGFFVLSGYLITSLYFRHLKEGSMSPGAFLINRGVRLYAVLVPVLVGSGLLVYFSPLAQDISARSFGAHLLFLQPLPLPYFAGNKPLWSLGYEGWCYIAFCGLLSGAFQIARGERAKGLLWLLIGAGPLLLFSVWMTHYFALWCLGALSALYAARTKGSSHGPRRVFRGAACVFALLGLLAARWGVSPPLRDYAVAVPLAVTLGLGSGAGLGSDLGSKERVSASLERWGAHLAGITYSLYLTHFPLVLLFKHFFGSEHLPNSYSFLLWGALVVGCVVFAYLFSAFTERQTNTVRDFLSRKLNIPLRPMAENSRFGPSGASSR